MNEPTKKFDRSTHQAIRLAIVAAINSCKHHQKYTKRVEDVVRAMVRKVVPDAIFCLGLGRYGIYSPSLCHYSNSFGIYWNPPGTMNATAGQHWSEPILRDLERENLSDIMEREAQEDCLAFKLQALENVAVTLQKQMGAIRREALDLIQGLSVPASATVRSSSCHWDHPSSKAVAQYPVIFGDGGGK